MRVSFTSKDLPKEILDLMINQRVTARVSFDVNNISIDSDAEWDDSIAGEVTLFTIESKTGGGGLDPVVERGIRQLKTLVHGTMG